MTVAMTADGRKQDEHTLRIILSALSVRDKASSHRRRWLTTSSRIKEIDTYSGTNQTGRVYASHAMTARLPRKTGDGENDLSRMEQGKNTRRRKLASGALYV